MTERFSVRFEIEIDDDSLQYFTEEPYDYLACNFHYDSNIYVFPENPDAVARKIERYKNEAY